MIKWFSIALFIAIVLCKPVTQFSWEVWYLANYEFVSEELCENTEEPMLQCNGKCYLAKQLEKAEAEKKEQDSEQPLPPFQVEEEYVCFSSFSNLIQFTPEYIFREKDYFGNQFFTDASPTDDIFHPPQV